jgi:hypothetical protein
MPYSEEIDDRDASGWVRTNLNYDGVSVHHDEVKEDENKTTLIIDITSNDEVMHLPSIEKAFRECFSKFIDDDGVNRIVNSLIKTIKEDDRMTTQRWEFAVPLNGPQFNQLVVQVYPTWDSWQHLRKERK